MVMNQINELSLAVSYQQTPFKWLPGRLELGNQGLEFSQGLAGISVQIPYQTMKRVYVQAFFHRYFYGVMVITERGQYTFRTWQTRRIVHVLNRKLVSGIVRFY